jgi:Predicted HKD family nuclease
MAEREFILQGFTAQTHAKAVRDLFDIENIQSVILSVAFISDSGVQEISERLAPHAAICTVYAGIRNDITSIQGLTSLLNLTNNLFVVDTGSRTVLFHPKLYFVKGAERAKLVIGSANLTLGGLNNNIEAGMLIDFDLADAKDRTSVERIEEQFASLAIDYPENIIRVAAPAELDAMLAHGRITDESIAAPPKPGTSSGIGRGSGNSDPIPRIRLKVPPLRAKLKKAKAAAKGQAHKGRYEGGCGLQQLLLHRAFLCRQQQVSNLSWFGRARR